MQLATLIPMSRWARSYDRRDLRGDLAAGVTSGAMLVPQAMAYSLLAGLPPEIGLYAATVPVLVYAVFGSSRQLSVGPVAIVSILTASALAPLVEEGTAGYLSAAALLALMVGAVHLLLGAGRLGFLVNFLSHAVLVGFTAASAVIIAVSQVKHLLGISVPSREHLHQTVLEVFDALGSTHTATLAIAVASLVVLSLLKRFAPRVPAALVVVVGSIGAVELLDLEARGVAVVGDIPGSLPAFGLPAFDGSLIGNLAATAVVITLVGFTQSIAVAKVYARRHRYDIDPNQELVGIGAANVAAGLFGGLPVTGGFSRTAVNDSAGARTPLASIITAGLVVVTIVVLTPFFESLPNAALGATIVSALVGLVDVREMRSIAAVKRSDLVALAVAFVATLALGIEVGIGIAVLASIVVVFARMSRPHSAVLGHVPGTTSYRNTGRFLDVEVEPGIRIVRIDAAVSFVNATHVKALLRAHAAELVDEPRVLILDASGIGDLDTTGVAVLGEVLDELDELGVELHLSDVRGPVRDVLWRARLWERLGPRAHASTHDAVRAVHTGSTGAGGAASRPGVDERDTAESDLTLDLETGAPS
jgi:SulP family sulfate permease